MFGVLKLRIVAEKILNPKLSIVQPRKQPRLHKQTPKSRPRHRSDMRPVATKTLDLGFRVLKWARSF